MKNIVFAALTLSTLMTGVAFAEDSSNCTDVSKDKWMSEDAVKTMAKADGLDVRKLKVEGSCYEIYAINAKGEKVEALFDPSTGKQVGNEGAE